MTKSTAAICESLIGKTLIGFDTRAEVIRPVIAKVGENMRVSGVMAGEQIRTSTAKTGEGMRVSKSKIGESMR